MSARTWNKDRAAKRIDAKIAELPLNDIEIKDYVKDTDLTNLPTHTAYRVNGAHLYADIINLDDLLHVTDGEGEMCHRRTLRFLNLHYRAVHRILQRVDAIFVDFHNQRLHSVVANHTTPNAAAFIELWRSASLLSMCWPKPAKTQIIPPRRCGSESILARRLQSITVGAGTVSRSFLESLRITLRRERWVEKASASILRTTRARLLVSSA